MINGNSVGDASKYRVFLALLVALSPSLLSASFQILAGREAGPDQALVFWGIFSLNVALGAVVVLIPCHWKTLYHGDLTWFFILPLYFMAVTGTWCSPEILDGRISNFTLGICFVGMVLPPLTPILIPLVYLTYVLLSVVFQVPLKDIQVLYYLSVPIMLSWSWLARNRLQVV